MPNRERVIIEPGQAGLGDNLTYSTLPERYVRERNADVYIRHVNFRNQGIADLVWNKNPFVKGIVYEPGTIGGMDWTKFAHDNLEYNNPIKTLEVRYGFKPTSVYPKLYNLNLKYREEFSDKVIIDLGAVTVKYSVEFLERYLYHLVYNLNVISLDKCIIVEHMDNINSGQSLSRPDIFPKMPRIKTENIFDFVDIIFSCDIFVAASSGSTPLASAIKQGGPYPRHIFSAMANYQYNQKMWIWPDVHYITAHNNIEEFLQP